MVGCLARTQAAGDAEGQINALIYRSLAYQELGHMQLALADLKRARGLAQQAGDTGRVTAIDSQIGGALTALGSNDEAMAALSASLADMGDSGNPAVVSSALNSLGSVLYARQNFDGASWLIARA